jgi:exportin-1
MSSDEAVYRRDRAYISKLNTILVAVLKQEWPARWPTFITDLVAAAKSSETLCENCMHILKLLSEEVFDFSRGELTQAKIKELKHSLNNEFAAGGGRTISIPPTLLISAIGHVDDVHRVVAVVGE